MMRLGTDPLRRFAPFDRDAALSLALGVLSAPPALPRIKRPAPRGALVQRFVLPLELCPTTNRTRHSRPGQFEPVNRALLAMLQQQARCYRVREPLPGRPQVLCLRLSATEPDKYSDWAKMAVDALCVPAGRRKEGLGYLRDDRPKDADVHQWWERAPRGSGCVYLEVRTG